VVRGEVRSYQDLEVWRTAIDLVERCYRYTALFPKEELFGLTAQIRRASVSIPANIAERYGRDQTGYFIQFLRIAQGSARELETHLIIAYRVGLPKPSDDIISICERVSKMLRALIRSLERAAKTQT
jgi:four helix bundle protein